MPLCALHDERGFTLIEVLVTMFVLLIGIGGAVAMIDGAAARSGSNQQRAEGTALARELLEQARAVPYSRLTQGGATTALQGQVGLNDQDGASGWQIKRRGTSYTVTLAACSVDDPRDGTANTSEGGHCSSTAASTPPDRDPDDYKRVTVTLDWEARGIPRTLRQAAVISNESSTTGPRITAMTRSPNDAVITSKGVPHVDFNVTTATAATAVKYAVDGMVTSTDAPSGAGTSSSFQWNIDSAGQHVPDGTYLVTATAYDADGRPGTSRSLTVRLNRDSPAPVQGVRGGWNALRKISEIEWALNNESDIQGYRVYVSVDGGTRTLVPECSVDANVTRCAHLNPPLSGSLAYYVVAVDADALTNLPREGDLGSPLAVVQSNNQPNQPGSFSAQADGGDVVLTWTAPAPASPSYSGDSIAFFRIYRDGQAYGDRHDYTGQGTAVSIRDSNAAEGGHSYWITAVDQNYSESEPLGPVSTP